MPGPNSAPNGDGRLVKGYPREDWVWNKERKVWVHMRDLHGMRSGKTDQKRK